MKSSLGIAILVVASFISPAYCQRPAPASKADALQFEFTKMALRVLKGIERVDGVPPMDHDASAEENALLDELDTLARSSGETKTVELLKQVATEMSVNNLARSTAYYNFILSQPLGSIPEQSRKAALEATMNDPGLQAVSHREQVCTASIDKCLGSAVTSQPTCKALMDLGSI